MHASESQRKDLSRVIELAWAEFARKTSMEWKSSCHYHEVTGFDTGRGGLKNWYVLSKEALE